MRHAWFWWLCGLWACSPGPISYLDAARTEDAGVAARDDAGSERAGTPCEDDDDCTSDEDEPVCDEQRLRCVECHIDSDCEDDETCEAGDCKDR